MSNKPSQDWELVLILFITICTKLYRYYLFFIQKVLTIIKHIYKIKKTYMYIYIISVTFSPSKIKYGILYYLN